MRLKKVISILSAAALFVSSCPVCGILPGSAVKYAEAAGAAKSAPRKNTIRKGAEEGTHYFYDQLTEEAKAFYDAMVTMYREGTLKTGTEDYDLTSNGCVTQEQLMSYANGDMRLLMTMGAARDAFDADYPDAFYVDLSNLSLRVTMDSEENYHAYLGTERTDTYYAEGFTNRQEVEEAVSEYEAKLDEIVAAAEKITPEEGENLARKQVEYVHDIIIKNTSYRLENTCKKENIGLIRTSYGALVKGESVCEGYSRAMKAVLDRLGIPCVLVQGSYRTSDDKAELHMWDYVQLEKEGEWYAVDATMDDPISSKGENGVDGYENTEYLFVGEDVMSRRHVPNGIMSEAEFEFSYPQLSLTGIDFERLYSKGGLTVLYNEDGTMEGEKAGVFKVSYNGMGYAKAAEQGKYLIGRFHQYYEETDEWLYGSWGYLLPDVYPAFEDTDTEMTIAVPHCLYVEFGVTDIAPGNYLENIEKVNFQGDPLLLEESTGMQYNPSGTYVAPPMVQSQTPSGSGRLYVGKKYHVKAVYDDVLTLADGATEAGYRLTVDDPNSSAQEYSKIENFTWDGEKTIEFDFEPSNMWADDSISYEFHITGLIGKRSLKTPNPICYYVANQSAVCAYRSRGYFWNLFGKPSLLENSDLSTKDWRTEDGGTVSQDMLKRLVLVASTTTNRQADDMNQLIDESLPSDQKVLKSETYNINLTICNQNIVGTGQSLRVSLGFPAGYGPNDAGVTFKAYHFTKNDAGEIVSVEEIPCLITQYGLVILCDSFSPFAVTAVEDDGTETADDARTLILSNTTGGTLTGADSVVTMKAGESVTLKASAEEGYELDELVVCGSPAAITDKNSMTVDVKYEDLADGINIVDAKFAAASVHQKEEERGEVLVQPKAIPAEITMAAASISVKTEESFTIAPEIKEQEGVHTYQWYKDGAALSGERGSSITVRSASQQDAGEYSLVVTTTAGTVSTRVVSDICKVSVTDDVLEPAVITLKSKSVTVAEKERLEIGAEVTEAEGTYQYQWYKGGAAVNGKTEKNLVIDSVSKQDAGSYQLKVIRSLGGKSVEAASEICTVTVTEAKTDNADQNGDQQKDNKPTAKKTLSAVKNLTAVSTGTDRVKLTWKKLSGAKGYQIYRHDSKTKKFVKLADVKKVSYTDKTCLSGKAYRYKVRAYHTVDGKQSPGKYSKEAKIIVLPETTKKVSGKWDSSTAATLSFKKVSGATEYYIYRYDAEASEYVYAYKVKGKKLYQYREKTGKWKYQNKIGTKGKMILCTLTGLDSTHTLKYCVSTAVSQSGYQQAHSKYSKVIKLPSRR